MSRKKAPSRKVYQLKHFLPRYWPVWLSFGFGWCIAKLPFPLAIRLGKLLGRIMQRIGKQRRYITQRNIAACFPELDKKHQQRIVNESFESLGIAVIEISLAYWGSNKKLASLTHISGLEHLETARAKGQGAFIMTSHMTPLEICLRLFTQAQLCAAMYKPAHNDLFEAYSFAKRSRHCIPIPNRDLRPFLEHVKNGGFAIYLPDQHYGSRNSVFAPFFNIQCATISRTPQFVTDTNAMVFPSRIGRREDGYHIEVLPAIDYPSGDPVADATQLNQLTEDNIRMYPTQYLWQHRRFKHVPDGQPPIY